MKRLFFLTMIVVHAACTSSPRQTNTADDYWKTRPSTSPQSSSTPYVYATPAGKPSPPASPAFELGENLREEELKSISDRVNNECARRNLSDLACIELSHREIRKASVAQWQRDGKTWIIRN
jgi:hypothetical protein